MEVEPYVGIRIPKPPDVGMVCRAVPEQPNNISGSWVSDNYYVSIPAEYVAVLDNSGVELKHLI